VRQARPLEKVNVKMVSADEPSNLDLITPMFRHRRRLFAGAVVGMLLAIGYEIVSTPRYTATVVLVPAANRTELPQLKGGLAALSGLAGGKLGTGNVSTMDRFGFLLTSTRLAEHQIALRQVLQVLFPEQWDSALRRWKEPSGVIQPITGGIKQVFGIPAWTPPDKFAVTKLYEKNLTQAKVGDTDLVRLSYTDSDPARAERVLRWIVDDANEIVRADAGRRAKQQSVYLREQLRTTTFQDYRETLLSLLAQEEQTLMLSNSRMPFAADTIEGDATSPIPTSERPVTSAIAGALLGLVLTYLGALIAFNVRWVVPDKNDGRPDTRSRIASPES
jgi:hypothetical protein